jgi:DNA-binding NtrC family response regulator
MLLSALEVLFMKIAAKPARTVAAAMGRILYAENDAKVLAEQAKAFEQAGYSVERAEGRAATQQALQQGVYDAVVLGHTLTKDDRHHLPYMAKKSSAHTAVLVLHASGKHPAVDIAIDSREGDKAVVSALQSVVQQKALAAVS